MTDEAIIILPAEFPVEKAIVKASIMPVHYAGRIRHFRTEFKQNKENSAALMICTTVVRKIKN